jgi:hypothetical protein
MCRPDVRFQRGKATTLLSVSISAHGPEAGIPHGSKSVNRTVLSFVSDGSQRAAWTNGLIA